MYKKGMVLVIICLFIGASIVPCISGEKIKQVSKFSEKTVEDIRGFYPLQDSDFVKLYNMDMLLKGTEDCKMEKTHYTEKIYGGTSNDLMGENKKWTWMFYDDADFTNAFDPLELFAEEAYSGENLDVIVLQDKEYGPAKMWYIDENHNTELLEDMGEVNMGDYQTLYNFVEYSKANYPADRYFISFYDHGGGWMGACVDSTDNGWLTMDEIQNGLTEAGGVDIICFTAPCLMGALESVYELRDCVDVYVGSEETSGYGHWMGTIEEMCNILNDNSDLSNIEIGEQIIQLIGDNTPWPESITMSAIRTDKMEELANSIDIVASDFIDNFTESCEKVRSIYDDIQYFWDGRILDTYDFAEKYLNVEADPTISQDLINVMNCLSEAVIAECHGINYPGAHGLTIYFPNTGIDSNYADPTYGLDFSQDTLWDEFLIAFLEGPKEPNIDQKQTEYNNAFILCGDWMWAQTFVPTCDILTKVKLYILRRGDISTDVTVSIKSSRYSSDLTSVSASYDEIPLSNYEWIEFDFEDIEISPGNKYYLLCSALGGDNQANYYLLGGSSNPDSYPYGDVWITWPSGGWRKWDPQKDLCFKTYGGNKAPVITGPINGSAKQKYTYNFSYMDPNGDEDVFYYIDWGDGDVEEWIGPYYSGEVISVNHSWGKQGTYSLKVKGKNTGGIESDWATLEVSMPKNKAINTPFLRFLENHPRIFLLLRHMLRL